jgi:hypothetical protein
METCGYWKCDCRNRMLCLMTTVSFIKFYWQMKPCICLSGPSCQEMIAVQLCFAERREMGTTQKAVIMLSFLFSHLLVLVVHFLHHFRFPRSHLYLCFLYFFFLLHHHHLILFLCYFLFVSVFCLSSCPVHICAFSVWNGYVECAPQTRRNCKEGVCQYVGQWICILFQLCLLRLLGVREVEST